MTIVHELRREDGTMLAYLQARPAYCDRGRYHANIEAVGIWVSESDPWPRYYFDLNAGKCEVEAWLRAKKVSIADARWIETDTGIMRPFVHALQDGLPLCRFSAKVPGDWPEGHKWVAFSDLEHEKNIDCPSCIVRLPASRRGPIRGEDFEG